MLEARGLECVRGRRRLFHDLSFSIEAGDYVELRGPNGSGKTSLLRILSGLLPPTRGIVLWKGEPIDAIRESYLASIAYVGHRSAIKDELTAMENLRVSAALSGCDMSEAQAGTALERVQLTGYAETEARYLSEGQHRKLAVARLIACGRPLWLLDELQTSLDADAERLVRALLHEHVVSGGMVLTATHQERGRQVTRSIELAA